MLAMLRRWPISQTWVGCLVVRNYLLGRIGLLFVLESLIALVGVV